MKSLVIYFSHKGENWMENGIEAISKGNTEIAAEFIAEATNADLFEVERVKDYSSNYKECCDEAKEEIDHDIHPEIKDYLTSLKDYDEIFIGGPVWWNHLPTPMFTLLEKLDFKGKTVKYFTTHEGSGFGAVPSDIKKYCKGAFIKDGIEFRGHLVKNNEKEIKEWAKN